MSPVIRIRLRPEADVPFADQIRAAAGWNQTPDDWRLFLEWQPDGCYVAEVDGRLAGTATTTCYGTEVAWIGMVLVHPDCRRHGVGRALLSHCLGFLRERRIRSIKLDATPLGKTLYDQLGFVDEWTLARWETAAAAAEPPPAGGAVRALHADDWGQLLALDEAAFGACRQAVLRGLGRGSLEALVSTASPGALNGFGFLRAGSRATYLGPVIAATAEAGLALLRALLAQAQGSPVYCNIPDQNKHAVDLIQQAGFTRQRPFIRMTLGESPKPVLPSYQYSIADPALG